MKYITAAFALAIAFPAAAQTAPAGHGADHSQHGQHQAAEHAEHAQHQGAQHREHAEHQGHGAANPCCADRNNDGRMDCCEPNASGEQRECCAERPAAPAAAPEAGHDH